jgi:uncharacterized membrane protein YeiH
MDLLGVLVISIVTALGGGTLRDVVLGHHPVSWVQDGSYLVAASIAAVFVVLWVRLIKPFPTGGLLIADALGLAIATVIGTDIALRLNTPASAAVIMGVMTGVAGGVMRDVICNEIPLVFQREIYATASIAGAITFIALIAVDLPRVIAFVVAMLTVFIIRVSALRWQWVLPRFHLLDSLN